MRTLSWALCVVLHLVSTVGAMSMAAELQMRSPALGGNPADIQREVLWLDNPDFGNFAGSSEVIGEYGLETEIANDFVIEHDASIRKLTWWGTYWNEFDGTPTGAGFNIRFYMPEAECLPEIQPFLEYLLPGNNCCERYAEGGDQYSQYVYEYCLELPLPSGLYWLSVQMADHGFPPQWGRQGAEGVGEDCVSVFLVVWNWPEWIPADQVFGELWDASQMLEDVCNATAVAETSWGDVKALYRW